MTNETGRDDAAGGVEAGHDLRGLLRRATSEAHRRLDAGWGDHDFANRRDYETFLAAMAAALVPLEADLNRATEGAVPPDWPARRRSAAILADLAALGRPAPPAPASPRAPGRAEVAGLLYVLEGSRLGGQLLLRRALASSDPVVRDNTRFLRHGEGLRLWPSFTAWLASCPPTQADGAVAGALRAFSLFEAAQAAQARAGEA
jgi:heme oxygenase